MEEAVHESFSHHIFPFSILYSSVVFWWLYFLVSYLSLLFSGSKFTSVLRTLKTIFSMLILWFNIFHVPFISILIQSLTHVHRQACLSIHRTRKLMQSSEKKQGGEFRFFFVHHRKDFLHIVA